MGASSVGPAPDETRWWFQTAELTFGFLESEFGMAIVKRHYHQEGNYIVYEGPTWSFSIECAPDWNSMSAWVTFDPRSWSKGGPIEDVLAQSEPETDWRFHGDSGPVNRSAVIRTMDLWARGLRDHIGSSAPNLSG